MDITKQELLAETRWLRFCKMHYNDRGVERQWDFVERSSRANTELLEQAKQSGQSLTDGVDILAIAKQTGKPDQIILVYQYRPPVRNWVLELPAGLVDAGESPAQCALRELEEETGYIGVVDEVTHPLVLSPGLTNENTLVVRATINMDDSKSKTETKQEETENIETVLMPVAGLFNNIKAFMDERKCEVDAKLYTFAWGMQFAADQALFFQHRS